MRSHPIPGYSVRPIPVSAGGDTMGVQFQEPNDQDALVIDPTFEQRERLIEGVHDLADEVHDLADEVKGFREHLGGMRRASRWQNILQAALLLPTLAPAVPLAFTAVGFLRQPE